MGGSSMKLSDEELDKLIKERITWELEQLPAPSVDEEWLEFKRLVLKEQRSRRIRNSLAATAAVAMLLLGSLALVKPNQVYALGERFLQMLTHMVGETTQNKTETVNNDSSGMKPPEVNNLGELVEQETTLEEAQKKVNFPIVEPKYLPPGAKIEKIILTNLSADVNRITINYILKERLIVFTQQNMTASVSQGTLSDTDDSVSQAITINGASATLLQEKNDMNVLSWYQRGLLLKLRGQLPLAEIIKIAESVS
ncbi:uncharacterized protein DUF4367 [Desulfitobacterium sp. LBE]|uniref:DUF4367 domain-containing protein n=3 Tax=root TaxID=1 RepID=A0A098B4F6_DESHA|nr:uncharacterized protein DUF4367 [Desulfitobacterium sp. LBE]CDX02741.1 Protein of unknown function (DUF4367) [Desulfitobacterium hafniense]